MPLPFIAGKGSGYKFFKSIYLQPLPEVLEVTMPMQ